MKDKLCRRKRTKALLRRYVEEAWGKGGVEVADGVFGQRYVSHQPQVSTLEGGPKDVKDFLRRYHEAFSDLQITIEDQIAEGDRVVTHWSSRGSQQQCLSVRLVHDAS